MRIVQHKRKITHLYNPSLRHHCGYLCLLKAAKQFSSKRIVSLLRHQVAERVRTAFLADEQVHDLKVRHVVAQRGHNLASYLAQIKDSQWASMVEMHYAAQILNIAVYLDMGSAPTR